MISARLGARAIPTTTIRPQLAYRIVAYPETTRFASSFRNRASTTARAEVEILQLRLALASKAIKMGLLYSTYNAITQLPKEKAQSSLGQYCCWYGNGSCRPQNCL